MERTNAALLTVGLVAAGLGLSTLDGCATSDPLAAKSGADSSRSVAAARISREEAVAAFASLHAVATGPRCANCHSGTDRPLQLDGLERQFHSMNVQRRLNELGHSCQTCHQDHNLDRPHLPPGAPHWRMPSAIKGFATSITAHDLCGKWTNRAVNFVEPLPGEAPPLHAGRTPQEMLAHVTTDPLVRWTWEPGPGRVSSAGTHEQFVEKFAIWVAGGSPCPN